MTQLHKSDCKRIWLAALRQVVRDLVGASVQNTSARNAAETWVGDYPSKQFQEVCAYAEVDYRSTFNWLHALCQVPIEARRGVFRARSAGADAIFPEREAA